MYGPEVARVLVVGGGIVGTAHAYEAIARGYDVHQFEAAPESREASVRSLGLLSFSCAAPGLDLDLSVSAREMWATILHAPERASGGAGELFRPIGSCVIAADDAELATLEKLAAQPDAVERGWALLPRASAEAAHPALAGRYSGALRSEIDAVIEPAAALRAMRSSMEASGRYTLRAGTEIREIESDGVVDHLGKVTRGDLVVVCPGASFRLAESVLTQPNALRAVRIQAVQTAGTTPQLDTSLMDLTSLLNHGVQGTRSPHREVQPGEAEIAVRVKCAPRRDGGLLVGEVQDGDDPAGFDLVERPMAEVLERLGRVLGSAPLEVTRRWSGVVHDSTDARLWYRENLEQSVVVVAGTDERGVTLAPAIARDTFDWLIDGSDSGATTPGAKID